MLRSILFFFNISSFNHLVFFLKYVLSYLEFSLSLFLSYRQSNTVVGSHSSLLFPFFPLSLFSSFFLAPARQSIYTAKGGTLVLVLWA